MQHRYSTRFAAMLQDKLHVLCSPVFPNLKSSQRNFKNLLNSFFFIYIFFSEKALSPLSQFYLESKKSIENDIPHFSKTIVRVNYMYIII